MCWKIIAIITENARNNTHRNKSMYICMDVRNMLLDAPPL
jgi:hypothetical protein